MEQELSLIHILGKLELRDYGYTAEDMVQLRKEAALDYHRMCSKIYCLGSDGSKGEYASKEMIQAHDGLFGMELQMWERIKDNNLDYAEENLGAFQEPMSVIEQEEALKLYEMCIRDRQRIIRNSHRMCVH